MRLEYHHASIKTIKGDALKLMVIDGHGGGIGAAIIKRLREAHGNAIEILAMGTNSIATSRMMKAGANRGATGQNAVAYMSGKVDVIAGPVSILMANSMMGEMTEAMASAVCTSDAHKVLIPLSQEKLTIAGVSEEPLPHLVDMLVDILAAMIRES
jgi:hypothetical protein